MAQAKKTTAKAKTSAKAKTETKKETPMFDFDNFTKLFDKAPQFDMTAVMDFQRKNVEAMVAANTVLFDCAKSVATKQADFAKDAAAEASEKASKAFHNEAPEFNLTNHVEEFQTTVKTMGENARSVSDMTVEASQKAFGLVQERYTASVEEFKKASKL